LFHDTPTVQFAPPPEAADDGAVDPPLDEPGVPEHAAARTAIVDTIAASLRFRMESTLLDTCAPLIDARDRAEA
jgi:hypothetical protein